MLLSSKSIVLLMLCLLLPACDSPPGEPTKAALVQAISARVQDNDWNGLQALAVNPGELDEAHKELYLKPRGGGLRAWTFKPSAEAAGLWGEAVAFEGLEECDLVILMCWTVPVSAGVATVDVFFPVVKKDDRYAIRFLKPREKK